MQQLFPLERPLLLDRVQVTYSSLRRAHAQLGNSLVLFEHLAAARSTSCKQAIKTVRAMGGQAASLHAYLLTQDYPASLTIGLRLRLGVLMQYTNKAAMQLVLVESCCRSNTALASWLHQQACTYLDTVMQINKETLYELARFAAQVCRAASGDQQQESVERGDGAIALPVPESPAGMTLRHEHLWRRKDGAHTMYEEPQPTPMNTAHHHQLLTAGMGPGRGTGPGENPARLLPTALMGPAQHGREPSPIILPRIAIGRAVAPHVPALPPAGAEITARAAASHPTLVLAPVTNEEQGQDTGAHEPRPEEEAAQGPVEPEASPGQEQGYPVMTTPIPTPGDLHHTTPFPSAPVQHQAQRWSPRNPQLFLAALGSGLFLSLLALLLIAVFVAPVATLAATVTLVPETKTLSTRFTVTALSTGTPDPARQQVKARLLEVSSPLQSQSGPTTGTGHAPARMGEGTVTFYNAAPYSQTVAAGTVLTGNDGVEIVTAAPAVIPAGNPPIEGEATVPAHAAAIGPQGNIAPLDLNGLCCLAGISVKNTMAFHDGQDAYDFLMVTQADIDHAAGPLTATLTAATQEHLHAAVHQSERLAGPVQCQPAVTPDHPVGGDASQVTVSVSVACHAQAYDHEAVVRLVTGALVQQAMTALGSGYALHGTISTTLTPAGAPPHAKPGTLTLLVTGQGAWVYQVSAAEQARLTRLIAGLSRQQAMRVLQQQEPGHLAAVHIQVNGLWTDGSRLPADPARIQLIVPGGGKVEQ